MKTILFLIIFIISLSLCSFKLSNQKKEIKHQNVNTWKDILIDGKDIAGVRSDGTAWVWKNAKIEQVGTDKDWEKFFLCTPYICQKEDGTIWSWNDEAHPNLGYKVKGNSFLTPHKIGSDFWIDVGGGRTVFGIKSDGSMYIWGILTEYFTNEVYIKQYEPLRIWNYDNWQSITSKINEEFILGIQTDGSLWACGQNKWGEFGNGTKISGNVPVRVGSDNDWAKVSTEGINGAFAIKKDGTLWAWGHSAYTSRKPLGLEIPMGSEKDSAATVPMQLGTDSDWADIAVGDFHRLALKKDGTLWSWGKSLGLSQDRRKVSMVQVGTDNDWVKIDAGLYVSVAIKKDGTAWLWGENKNNQLGLNTPLEIVSEPTQLELKK